MRHGGWGVAPGGALQAPPPGFPRPPYSPRPAAPRPGVPSPLSRFQMPSVRALSTRSFLHLIPSLCADEPSPASDTDGFAAAQPAKRTAQEAVNRASLAGGLVYAARKMLCREHVPAHQEPMAGLNRLTYSESSQRGGGLARRRGQTLAKISDR